MTTWRKYRTAIYGTFAALGVWLAAITAYQPTVTPPPLPIAACGANEWQLTNDYHTAATVGGVAYRITIRRGASMDGASIPDSLEGALGLSRMSPCLQRAALTHDVLYGTINPDETGGVLPKATIDLIFWQMALDDGCNPQKAEACYEAVKLWGFTAIRSHTPESVAKARGLVSVTALGR